MGDRRYAMRDEPNRGFRLIGRMRIVHQENRKSQKECDVRAIGVTNRKYARDLTAAALA